MCRWNKAYVLVHSPKRPDSGPATGGFSLKTPHKTPSLISEMGYRRIFCLQATRSNLRGPGGIRTPAMVLLLVLLLQQWATNTQGTALSNPSLFQRPPTYPSPVLQYRGLSSCRPIHLFSERNQLPVQSLPVSAEYVTRKGLPPWRMLYPPNLFHSADAFASILCPRAS